MIFFFFFFSKWWKYLRSISVFPLKSVDFCKQNFNYVENVELKCFMHQKSYMSNWFRLLTYSISFDGFNVNFVAKHNRFHSLNVFSTVVAVSFFFFIFPENKRSHTINHFHTMDWLTLLLLVRNHVDVDSKLLIFILRWCKTVTALCIYRHRVYFCGETERDRNEKSGTHKLNGK